MNGVGVFVVALTLIVPGILLILAFSVSKKESQQAKTNNTKSSEKIGGNVDNATPDVLRSSNDNNTKSSETIGENVDNAMLDVLRSIKTYLGWILFFIIILTVMKGCDNTSSLLKSIDKGVKSVDEGVWAPREYRGTIKSY